MMTVVGAILTMVAPLCAAWIAAWLETRKDTTPHETVDQVDADILRHQAKDPAGLVQLSRTLERLHREASRKRRHHS